MKKNEIKFLLDNLKIKGNALIKKVNFENLVLENKEIEAKLQTINYQDQNLLKELNIKLNHNNKLITEISKIKNSLSNYEELFSLIEDENDLNDFYNELLITEKEIKEKNLEVSFNSEYDINNAIIEIHPGAGGVEAQDWASMLLRMYQKYFEKRFKKVFALDIQKAEPAGIKSATLEVQGEFAYGYLKSEKGVHRLVRISPFDANKKRHTSFASVMVMPKVDNDNLIIIKSDEIRIDNYYSSGAGGQSVNTTMSAVRITHIPTGIVVSCQNERSQIQNKERALNILKSKLLQRKIEEQEMELKQIKGMQAKIEWGSQIRSYVFQPYQLVKDHRTNYEESNIQSIMDGNIDNFINTYIEFSTNE